MDATICWRLRWLLEAESTRARLTLALREAEARAAAASDPVAARGAVEPRLLRGMLADLRAARAGMRQAVPLGADIAFLGGLPGVGPWATAVALHLRGRSWAEALAAGPQPSPRALRAVLAGLGATLGPSVSSTAAPPSRPAPTVPHPLTAIATAPVAPSRQLVQTPDAPRTLRWIGLLVRAGLLPDGTVAEPVVLQGRPVRGYLHMALERSALLGRGVPRIPGLRWVASAAGG